MISMHTYLRLKRGSVYRLSSQTCDPKFHGIAEICEIYTVVALFSCGIDSEQEKGRQRERERERERKTERRFRLR